MILNPDIKEILYSYLADLIDIETSWSSDFKFHITFSRKYIDRIPNFKEDKGNFKDPYVSELIPDTIILFLENDLSISEILTSLISSFRLDESILNKIEHYLNIASTNDVTMLRMSL